MRYILPRNIFLIEALKDEITKSQADRVAELWGEEYLDYQTVKITNDIETGKWKLSQEDADQVINKVFNTNRKEVTRLLKTIPKEFENTLKEAMDKKSLESEDPRLAKVFEKDWTFLTLRFKQVAALYKNIFKKISINETRSSQIIQRNEKGIPLRDDDNNIIKVDKEPGEIVFTNNKVNINTFIEDWNKVRPDDQVDESMFKEQYFQNIYSIYNDNDRIGDFSFMSDSPVYLYISGSSKDILNMSVSPFFTSCQELYTGGGHGNHYVRQLLSNVFDPNSAPAFLMIDTPYFGKDGEELSDMVALSRLTIRNMTDYGGDSRGLYFDKCYPDRMEDITTDMIEKYTSNADTGSGTYIFAPSVDVCDIGSKKPGAEVNLSEPYMDRLPMSKRKTLNINSKQIIFKKGWLDQYDGGINLNPGDKLKQIIIQTNDLPDNFSDLELDIDWIKFQYMKINNLRIFDNIITDAVAFDKCYIDNNVWREMITTFKRLEKVSVRSLDTNKRVSPIEFGRMKELKELEIIYSFKYLNPSLLESNSLKTLTISGDMLREEKNKEIVKQLKNRGVKIKTVGLVF